MAEEKSPEGIPAGWSVEHRERKSGKKDKYYTDPVSGYVFRSLKDVQRYLKTGELGRLAFKPKDKTVEGDMEEVELPVRVITLSLTTPIRKMVQEEKPVHYEGVTRWLLFRRIRTRDGADRSNLADKQISEQISENQSLELNEAKCDGRNYGSIFIENQKCVSEHASDLCSENPAIDINVPEANKLEEKEENGGSMALILVPDPLVESSQEKRPPAKDLEECVVTEPEISKSSAKSKLVLPRRSSRRLAGIKVDEPVELKTQPKPPTGQAGEVSASGIGEGKMVIKSPKDKQVNPAVLAQTNLPSTRRASKRLAGLEVVTPPEPKTRRQLSANRVAEAPPFGNRDKMGKVDVFPSEKKGGKMDHLPSEKIVQPDPPHPSISASGCEKGKPENVLSAVQVTLEESKGKMDIFPGPLRMEDNHKALKEVPGDLEMENKPCKRQESPCNHPPGSLFTPEDPAAGKSTGDKAEDVRTESQVNLSLADLWTDPCIEFAVKTLTGEISIGNEKKVDECLTNSSLGLPLGELWADPCIEFAVKTLTGAIPIGADVGPSNFCHTETRRANGLRVSDVGPSRFSPNNILSKHFETADSSSLRQPELALPGLPNCRNVNSNAGGAIKRD